MASASEIKSLRQRTGAGMLDCKKALEQTKSIDEAIKWLRDKGITKGKAKAHRDASEGVVVIVGNKEDGLLIAEVNCETDFVAKNASFQEFANKIANHMHKNNITKTNKEIEEMLNQETFRIGEKILVKRAELISAKDKVVSKYIHSNKKIGVVLVFDDGIEQDKAYGVAMHVAAMSPQYISRDDVEPSFIEGEKTTILKELEGDKRPEKIQEKIIEGKLSKILSEVTLLDQVFSLSEKKEKVGQMIGKTKVLKMIRYEVGV